MKAHDFKTLPYFLWCLITNMVNILVKMKSSKRGEETGRRKASFTASHSWLAQGKCSPLRIDTVDRTYYPLLDLQGSLCIWIMDYDYEDKHNSTVWSGSIIPPLFCYLSVSINVG